MLSSTNSSPSLKSGSLLLAALRAERQRRDESERRRQELIEHSEMIRERCKTLRGFIREAWHVLEPTTEYIHGWHHDAIAAHLEAIHHGEITRLQINEPPGAMKSVIVSVMFQAWEWGPGGLPGLRYFTTSYKEGYARRDSRKTRDLVLSEWYRALWPEIVLVRDNETDFENTARGNRLAMPFASLTSGRGNRLLIDDPHSVDTAESEADREKITRRFRESVTSRLNNPERDAIVVIMHRLHPEDVCGVIETLQLPYVKLVLPMEYVKSLAVKTPFFEDPRKIDGELLHPERIGREKIEQNKLELGPHAYDTQYQQMPRAREGSYFFSRENILGANGEPVAAPAKCDAVFAVIDTATKTGKKRDGTGVTYFAFNKYPTPLLVILDWDIQQIEASLLTVWLPTVFSRLEEFARKCGARAGSIGAWIEDKDSGMVLLQHAERGGLPARPIESAITALGKDGRALSVSGYFYKDQVKICAAAYEKTTVYKGRSRNHLVYQVTTYKMGAGTPTDEDELFDTTMYGASLALGNSEGF
jgi:hypothetical protein